MASYTPQQLADLDLAFLNEFNMWAEQGDFTTLMPEPHPGNCTKTPKLLEITLGKYVLVTFPAALLSQLGTRAIINDLIALFPPQQQHHHHHHHHRQLTGFDSQFTAAADHHHQHQPTFSVPAPAAPPPRPVPQRSIPRRAARHHHHHHHRTRQTPPGFTSYRHVAQHVALHVAARRPVVQLGEIYAFMEQTWPGHFARPSGTGRPASWQSGVRHAVLKHFDRVPGCQAPAPGVWYKVDVGRLV